MGFSLLELKIFIGSKIPLRKVDLPVKLNQLGSEKENTSNWTLN